jgi:hypothetical protein
MEIADRVINDEGENLDQNSLEIWKVLMREWFGRIWVVQEFVASSSCLVYIGPIIVSPGIIFQVVNILRFSVSGVMSSYSGQLAPLNPTVLNAGLFWNLKNWYQSPHRLKIHELVVKTTTFDATVPVDGIFALFGLASVRTVSINIAKNALMSFKKGYLSAFDFLTFMRQASRETHFVNLSHSI